MSSLKAIVREFIKELIELQDEPLNEESINKIGRLVDEFEIKSKNISNDLRSVVSYLYAKLHFMKAIQELNKFIDE